MGSSHMRELAELPVLYGITLPLKEQGAPQTIVVHGVPSSIGD